MKIRSGFVSNSSSSSFVIVTTPEKWAEAKKKLIEQVGENVAFVIMSEYGKGEKAKILGQDALVFQGIISSEEFGYDAVTALEKRKLLTEEEAENISIEAYDHLGDLDKILDADGVSYTNSTCC